MSKSLSTDVLSMRFGRRLMVSMQLNHVRSSMLRYVFHLSLLFSHTTLDLLQTSVKTLFVSWEWKSDWVWQLHAGEPRLRTLVAPFAGCNILTLKNEGNDMLVRVDKWSCRQVCKSDLSGRCLQHVGLRPRDLLVKCLDYRQMDRPLWSGGRSGSAQTF